MTCGVEVARGRQKEGKLVCGASKPTCTSKVEVSIHAVAPVSSSGTVVFDIGVFAVTDSSSGQGIGLLCREVVL